MSSSRRPQGSGGRARPGEGRDLEAWFAERYAETSGFTALLLLLDIADERVSPISCAHLHVIGPDVGWRDMKTMLDASRRRWDGVAIFVEAAPGGGPVIDLVAKARLQGRIDEVTANRMVLNDAGLFDTLGRRFRVDPAGGA